MKVYMIRHGESETNEKGLWTGWLDVSLTERGKAQARQVGKMLSGISFDKIYASDLSRAKTTAELALPGREYETLAELREIHLGSLAGKSLKAVDGKEKERLLREGFGCFGGESQEEFCRRVQGFLKRLEAEEAETVAVFSHGGFLREALDTVLGTEMPRGKVLCNNCAVAVLEYRGRAWALHSWINH